MIAWLVSGGVVAAIVFVVFLVALSNVSKNHPAVQEAQVGQPAASVTEVLARPMMDDINTAVANDAIQQYEIAKRSGSGMDRCVHAGFVAAAFMQAKDEAGFAKWKAVEKKECARAGVPGM